MGKVYLVGAGCGSYDLITLRGMELLQSADCVLYDRLIDPLLLQFVSATCECIDVGKKNHHHTMHQRDIEELMVEKARCCTVVVRLKGGDPYVFGRGGEEALALVEAGISFEIIPGISSSIAALTYAGFPITQRGINTGFRVYSAHTKANICNEVQYEDMAKTSDTLIFLMGLQHRQELFQQLLTHGKPADTPVAMISNGARPTQQVVTATLQAAIDLEVALESPCTIVVGEVIALRDQLNFYEQKPLFGKRIAYPSLSKDVHTQLLKEAGAIVEEWPCGTIEELIDAIADINLLQYRYIVFTSRNGIHFFMKQLLQSGMDARAFAHTSLVCIGQKTAQALQQYGLHADIIASISDSEHLAAELNALLAKEERLLLVKARNANHILEKSFAKEQLTLCECYETRPCLPALSQAFYDAIIFTNAFAVHTCMAQLQHWQDIQQTPVFSIGASTTSALQSYGFEHIYQSKETTREALFRLVRKELSGCTEEED